MKLGWVGLGKLGMPYALTLAESGHVVVGVDPDPAVAKAVENASWPHDEPRVEWMIQRNAHPHGRFVLGGLEDLVGSDAVFVAVQTPHEPGYDGTFPMPPARRPFDTGWLRLAVEELARTLDEAASPAPIVVVSTVLPGTCRDELEPLLRGRRPMIYSPAFVAMGSVHDDLRWPEFVLAGVRRPGDADVIRRVHTPVSGPERMVITGVESAELAKMAYNTAISQKIVLANALAELADYTGANAGEVASVLMSSDRRVACDAYLRPGMGDGGPCHPRDGIAMAWLAEQAGVSADPFYFAVRAREAQARRLARRVGAAAEAHCLPVVVVGRAYKEGVSIETGSPALLVGHYLEADGHHVTWWDPPGGHTPAIDHPAVFLVALPDRQPAYPDGSVVINPWA